MHEFAYLSALPFAQAAALAQAPAAQPFAIAGIAYDGATTLRPGARFGPAAIRQASQTLCDAHHPHFDVALSQEWLGDAGDLPLPSTSLQAMRESLLPLAAELISRHHMVWLGGDHSITLPLLRAYRAHFGRPLGVVHFDAHCDTWRDHFGEPSGHGTWVYEAFEEGLVEPRCFAQLGIRSSADRAAREFVRDRGGLIWHGRDLRGVESPQALAPIAAAIAERWQQCGQPPLYLTLDIDCLDPAFAPGTGTPEPAGLNPGQLLSVLEALAALPFVGMDCTEVAPPYDHAGITSLAAAHAVWTYLCGQRARQTGA